MTTLEARTARLTDRPTMTPGEPPPARLTDPLTHDPQ
jgi:hypothetical protein